MKLKCYYNTNLNKPGYRYIIRDLDAVGDIPAYTNDPEIMDYLNCDKPFRFLCESDAEFETALNHWENARRKAEKIYQQAQEVREFDDLSDLLNY